jgi:hypothetical protein
MGKFGTVIFTKNDEGDLAVMNISAFTSRESMLHLRENLVSSEEDRLAGKEGFSIEAVDEMMKKTIGEIADGKHKLIAR